MIRYRSVRLKELISILSCVVVASALAIQSEEELWKNCTTPATHYVLQVPGSLVAETGPGLAGCTYHSPNGEFNVEADEQTDNQPLDARMAREIELLQGSISDQKRGDNWFALTGVTGDGTEFYRLHYTNGAQWVSLRITFPRSKAKEYDKWVTRIDKEFVPFKTAADNATQPTTTTAMPAPQAGSTTTLTTVRATPTPQARRHTLFATPTPKVRDQTQIITAPSSPEPRPSR